MASLSWLLRAHAGEVGREKEWWDRHEEGICVWRWSDDSERGVRGEGNLEAVKRKDDNVFSLGGVISRLTASSPH